MADALISNESSSPHSGAELVAASAALADALDEALDADDHPSLFKSAFADLVTSLRRIDSDRVHAGEQIRTSAAEPLHMCSMAG